jgi:manganese transport protein
VFTTIGGMSTLASYAVNSLFQISPDNSDPKVRKFILIGIVISLLAGIIKVNAMALLVNFIGLLNIGGFVIICILTYYSGNKKFAGEYVNKWYTTLIGVVIIAFNLYAVWSYITRFIK